MSACRRATARPPSGVARGPALALMLMLPLVATLAVRGVSVAEYSTTAIRLDPAAALRAGVALELVPRADLAAALVEVRPLAGDRRALGGVLPGPAGAREAARRAPTLLAIAPGGRTAAVAERVGRDPTTLVLAAADGAQVRVPFDGLLSAGYAPDGSWLAAIDGHGRLARVSPDGEVSPLAEGTYLGPPTIEPSGDVLALAVPSVEAPYRSHLVRIDPSAGSVTRLSIEELVYAARPLPDGSLAVVAHRPEGTVVLRLAAGEARLVADLGPGAVNVAVSDAVEVIAFERGGEVVVRAAGAESRLGAGTSPRLSADGAVLLVDRAGGTELLAANGTRLAAFSGAVALLACEECPS